MRRLVPFVITLLLLSLAALPAAAAPLADGVTFYAGASMRFEHLTVDDGLSQNAIQAMLQDHQGYLWIGTQDGLNRYDGYSFAHFRNDPANPNTISSNNVLALAEDAEGYLWIGTRGGGLNRYDPESGNFIRFLPEPRVPTSLSNSVVTAIFPSADGELWVGTLGGLDRLDPATGKFTHFSSSADPSTLSSDAISVIVPAGEGTLWIGTGAYGATGNGLNRFDPATGKAERITTSSACLQSPNISAILTNADGSLWIGHGGDDLPGGGLDHFTPQSGGCYHYEGKTTYGPFTSDNITSLLIDQNNFLWITVQGGGLLRADAGAIGKFTNLLHDPGEPDSLSSDSASTLLQDRSGVLWIGTYDQGLNKLDLENLQFRTYKNSVTDSHSLASNHVSAFGEAANGDIWVGTSDAGLDLFTPATGLFNHYRYISSIPDNPRSNQVGSLYVDFDGTLWIGTANNGLNHFDPVTMNFRHYQHNPSDSTSLIGDEVTAITRDNEGSLWVATTSGLSLFEASSGSFVNYAWKSGAPVTLMVDGGDLWIGTSGGGVSKWSLSPAGALPPGQSRLIVQFTLVHSAADPNSLSENSVWAIHKSADGLLWFGTSGGLNRYDPQTGEFKVYNESNGLPSSTILGIVEDESSHLWITTANGLVRFDPATESTRVYDESDGLQGNEFNPNACFISPTTGYVYVGGSDGFTTFNPLKITGNTTPPNTIITDFQVSDEAYPFDPTGKTTVRLGYTQNYLSFHFTSLDFHAPAKNTYAYMLEGYDQAWVPAGTRREAAYADLPAGDYTFRVKAANRDGVWSANEATLHIQITPPFWQMWQFQAGVIVAAALLLAGGFRWRMKADQRNAQRLERRIAERTEELSKANELLREKTAQEAVSAERTRLARELHDAVTQTLFSATLIADVLPELWDKNSAEGYRRLEELRQLTRGALAEMRTLLVELRPNALTEIPLPTLLRQFTEALSGRTRINIQLDCGGDRKLPANVQISFYRIAQEALNNVVKHAKATQAVVTLQVDGVVRMSIADNGVGFDPTTITADHLGLKIMRERAEAIGAKFNLYSDPGEGTQISVVWQAVGLGRNIVR